MNYFLCPLQSLEQICRKCFVPYSRWKFHTTVFVHYGSVEQFYGTRLYQSRKRTKHAVNSVNLWVMGWGKWKVIYSIIPKLTWPIRSRCLIAISKSAYVFTLILQNWLDLILSLKCNLLIWASHLHAQVKTTIPDLVENVAHSQQGQDPLAFLYERFKIHNWDGQQLSKRTMW